MSQRHNLYLIRHAQSEFNLAQMKAINSEVESKVEEDLTVKFDCSLIDCGISSLGKKQAYDAGQKLKDVNVSLVITSPLRRCLQTTQEIFKDHKNKPKVIVWPVVKEMLLSGCDVADDLETIKAEFPEYDFSYLSTFPIPELWLFYVFCKSQATSQELIDELFEKYSTRKEGIQNAKYFLVDKLKKTFPNTVEAQNDLAYRTIESKKALKEKLKEVADSESVAVIAHSRFLEAFTAEALEENGDPINAKWFYNCEVTPYDLEQSVVAESL